MPAEKDYGSPAREQPVKVNPNPPAKSVAEPLKNSQAQVDAAKNAR
jgi:hypothetical protein